MDRQLSDAIFLISSRLRAYDEIVESLPRTVDAVDAMLHELAEAERDCRNHIIKYRLSDSSNLSLDAAANWEACYTRRENAIRALTVYAMTIHSTEVNDATE